MCLDELTEEDKMRDEIFVLRKARDAWPNEEHWSNVQLNQRAVQIHKNLPPDRELSLRAVIEILALEFVD